MDEIVIKALCMLWALRIDTLRKTEILIGDTDLKQRLKVCADGYDQCIEELKHPPIELFKELGISKELGLKSNENKKA